MNADNDQAAGHIPRRLFHYNAGFLRDRRLRRILQLAGHSLHLGFPGPDDGVVVWGRSPYAGRGEAVAARRAVPLLRVEDAFLRSVKPGRAGDAPIGLMLDDLGVHFDSGQRSRLEHLLANHPLEDDALIARAAEGIARLKAADLSKYNQHDPALAVPEPGYVLVIDQTRGDASIRYGGATEATFAEMLAAARTENP
ncbi:MAG: capsular polysaccharide biosynthesis protein, partial [Paracoccaceae bacterium]